MPGYQFPNRSIAAPSLAWLGAEPSLEEVMAEEIKRQAEEINTLKATLLMVRSVLTKTAGNIELEV